MLRSRWAQIFVTCGGLGYLPKGSGTLASAVALIFWWVLRAQQVPLVWMVGLIVVLTVMGVWGVRIYEGSTGAHDSSEIVIDEWVGMGIAFLAAGPTWQGALGAFVLFRFFDIAKPLGIRFFDQNYLKGWGVMMDDVVAGLYAAALLGVWQWWISPVLNLG